ncbi:uncharacterized protein [Ptychodera flava]|uniref:uncharacterized protein n=1 Tax=Ptychodera flava TaxID=63121 RepID=UPI00396A232F
MTVVPQGKYTPANIAYTEAYLDYMQTKNARTIKFMDESGVKVNTGQSKYGHSPCGQRCVELGRYAAGGNHSVSLLIGYDGVKFCDVIWGPSDTNNYLRFFTEAAEAYDSNGQPVLEPGDTVVVDNAPIHRNEGQRLLTNWLQDLGIELVFLPTYSPEFNPTEQCFNKLKAMLNRITTDLYYMLACQ